MSGASNQPQGRACGECTACCIATAVEPLGKACGERCSYLGDRGCSVYAERAGDARFRDCVNFNCLWIQGWAEEQDRPDRLGGVVFAGVPDPDRAGQARIQIMESVPGLAEGPRVRYIIAQILAQGFNVMITNREYGIAMRPDGTSWRFEIDRSDPLRMRPDEKVKAVQVTLHGKAISSARDAMAR